MEIKCDVVMYWGIWDKLTALEREMNMQGRILYSSFNHDVLPYIRALDPKANIGLLYGGVPKKAWRDAVRMRQMPFIPTIWRYFGSQISYKNAMKTVSQCIHGR